MSWCVADIRRVCPEVDIARKKSTHSFKATRNGKTAPLPAHDGERSEVVPRDIRKFCKALDLDYERIMARLRGEDLPDDLQELDSDDTDSSEEPASSAPA